MLTPLSPRASLPLTLSQTSAGSCSQRRLPQCCRLQHCLQLLALLLLHRAQLPALHLLQTCWVHLVQALLLRPLLLACAPCSLCRCLGCLRTQQSHHLLHQQHTQCLLPSEHLQATQGSCRRCSWGHLPPILLR
jgi:hypothetical protein